MNNNRLSFPNGFEKTEVRWEKIKIKLAPNSYISSISIIKIMKGGKQNDLRPRNGI